MRAGRRKRNPASLYKPRRPQARRLTNTAGIRLLPADRVLIEAACRKHGQCLSARGRDLLLADAMRVLGLSPDALPVEPPPDAIDPV